METLDESIPPADPGAAVADQAGPAASGNNDGSNGGGKVSTRYLHRAMRALQRAGYAVATEQGEVVAPPEPASPAAQGGPAEPGQMVVGEGFNEAVSRAGITGLVDTADTIGTSIIGELAAVALDDAEAKHYTERAKMKPGIRDGLIINGVEVARIENTNVPPHLALIVLGGGWVTQLGLIAKELRQMRKERNAAPKEDEQ